jgi:hypothetical protein
MVPLFVRQTLVESNGTSAGGDQTQAQMARDRRYTGTMGRPLNRCDDRTLAMRYYTL